MVFKTTAISHSATAPLLAETEGFEPSEREHRPLVFETSAISHSAMSPDFYGGSDEIRTREGFYPLPPFQDGALSRSATLPLTL